MHYHRGCSVSLPCSEWERVGPLRSDHQKRRAGRLRIADCGLRIAGERSVRRLRSVITVFRQARSNLSGGISGDGRSCRLRLVCQRTSLFASCGLECSGRRISSKIRQSAIDNPQFCWLSDICIQVLQLEFPSFTFTLFLLTSDCFVLSHLSLARLGEGLSTFLQSKNKENDQAKRVISATELNTLLRLHPWSINVVVYHDPSGRSHLGRGLALRCFQRLSFPNIATQQCR